MVNVTKRNFLKESDDLIRHLGTAAFMVLDLEMTGITCATYSREDTPQERYEKCKKVPERYGIIQVGIALFHENPDYRTFIYKRHAFGMDPHMNEVAEDEEYEKDHNVDNTTTTENQEVTNQGEVERAANLDGEEVEPPEFLVRKYNFFIFPSGSDSHKTSDASNNISMDLSREITLNPSSIAFLTQHGMDFNMWMKEGIPFVTENQAEKLLTAFKDKYRKKEQEEKSKKKKKVQVLAPIRPDDIAFVARAMASLREWIDSASSPPPPPLPDTTNIEDTIAPGKSFLLPPCNSFLRRCLYETIEFEYPTLVLEAAPMPYRNQICVLRLNPDEKATREERIKRLEWEFLQRDQLGFWRVFRALSHACRGELNIDGKVDDEKMDSPQSKMANSNIRAIPLVLHNGVMDLLFLLTHFVSPTLPDMYQDAKTLIHKLFPVIYDTKTIASEYSDLSIQNDSTGLGDLFGNLCLQLGSHSSGIDGVAGDTDSNEPTGGPLVRIITSVNVSDNNSEKKEEPGQMHNAAYDAYMTGAVFHVLCKRLIKRYLHDVWILCWCPLLGSEISLERNDGVGSLFFLYELRTGGMVNREKEDDSYCRRLFGRNKLYLMQTLYTIDLEQPTDPLSRGMLASTAFRVSGIDTSVSTRDVVRSLMHVQDTSNDGGAGRKVGYEIVWVDNSTFLVATRSPDDEFELNKGSMVRNQEETLLRHGRLIFNALRRRFPTQSISTLDDHLINSKNITNNSIARHDDNEEELKNTLEGEVERGSGVGSTWSTIVARVGYVFGFGGEATSLRDDTPFEERNNKRRRV